MGYGNVSGAGVQVRRVSGGQQRQRLHAERVGAVVGEEGDGGLGRRGEARGQGWNWGRGRTGD